MTSTADTNAARVALTRHSSLTDGSTGSMSKHRLAATQQQHPPVYLPRADAMLLHRQLQAWQREHTSAATHGHTPSLPLPQPHLAVSDSLLDFEQRQKHGPILWPLLEYLRMKPPPVGTTQEEELLAAGYGLGTGKLGRHAHEQTTHSGGPKAQQAAAAAAAAQKTYATNLQQLTLPDHDRDDELYKPTTPNVPKSYFHPPPPVSLLDAGIPNTVVFEEGRIEAWYFSATSNEPGKPPVNTVLRKKRENCTAANVCKTFLEGIASKKITPWQSTRPLDVVATFYPKTVNDSIHQVVPMFLTRVQLERFVKERALKLRISGVLQAFVAPKQSHNTILRVEWTPAACKVLERRAGLPIENAKSKGKGYDIDSRLTTFERNWQVPISEGALMINDQWSEAERRQHEEEYLDMMLNGHIFGETSALTRTRNGQQIEGVSVTNTVAALHGVNPHIHPSSQTTTTNDKVATPAAANALGATAAPAPNGAGVVPVADAPSHVTTLAYNEHRMTQVECLDQALVQTLTSYAWCLAEHFRRVMVRHVRGSANHSVAAAVPALPVKLSIYFKLGAGGKIWLLFLDEFVCAQGAPTVMDKLTQQMNDPLRDHLLKLLTPPQDVARTSHHQVAAAAHAHHDATQQFMKNLPIISPTGKRAPFRPRMGAREWLRYRWSHWAGEYEWNRTLAILDLHREAKKEQQARDQATAAAFEQVNYGSPTALVSASAPTSPMPPPETSSSSAPMYIFQQLAREQLTDDASGESLRRRVIASTQSAGEPSSSVDEEYAHVPAEERPGTRHTCALCRQTFDLAAHTVLADHRVPVARVLAHLVAARFIRRKTPASIWHETLTLLYPRLSEHKCKQLLRSRKWYASTSVVLCDVDWQEVHGCPRTITVAATNEEDDDDGGVEDASVATTAATLPGASPTHHRGLTSISSTGSIPGSTTSHHRSLASMVTEILRSSPVSDLSEEVHAGLDELLRDFLQISVDEPILLDESSPTAIRARQEAELEERHRASTFSTANAQSIAAGMGDIHQRLATQRFRLSMEEASEIKLAMEQKLVSPSSSPTKKKASRRSTAAAAALEQQRIARAAALQALQRLQAEAQANDPSKELFPGLDGSPLHDDETSPVPLPYPPVVTAESTGSAEQQLVAYPHSMHVRESSITGHSPSARRYLYAQSHSVRAGEESLAAYHRQMEAERLAAAAAAAGSSSSVKSDGIAAGWTFLRNTAVRRREAEEREQRRLERLARHEAEQQEREAEERRRREGDPEERRRRAEKFRTQWLQRLEAEAEQRHAERQQAQIERQRSDTARTAKSSVSTVPAVPFPLLPAAGAHPRFPSPEVVAQYIRAHGLPESYIKAYERSYVHVLEPVTTAVIAEAEEEEEQQQAARESTQRSVLPSISSRPHVRQLQRIYSPHSQKMFISPSRDSTDEGVHAHTFDPARRPDANIHAHTHAKSTRRRSSEEPLDVDLHRTSSSKGTSFPSLHKSSSVPALARSPSSRLRPIGGDTTFGTEVGSPSRVPPPVSLQRIRSTEEEKEKPVSPTRFSGAPYALAVAEYIVSHHKLPTSKSTAAVRSSTASPNRTKEPVAAASFESSPQASPTPVSPNPFLLIDAHARASPTPAKQLRRVASMTTTGRAREEPTVVKRQVSINIEEKEAGAAASPVSASHASIGPTSSRSGAASPLARSSRQRTSGRGSDRGGGAAGSPGAHHAKSLSGDSTHSDGTAPLLDARSLDALHQLHAQHRAHGTPCSCDELLVLIHRGDPNAAAAAAATASARARATAAATGGHAAHSSNSARARLEAWLAEHEDASATLQLVSIRETDAEQTDASKTERETTVQAAQPAATEA